MVKLLNKLRYIFEKNWNESNYRRMRNYIQSNRSGGILSKILIMVLRRIESKKCCTTGLSLKGQCCYIESPLILYHGLNGIIIAPNVRIGKNVVIFQHVTIGKENENKETIIEDDVIIGAGAVILNNVRIGRGANIGANAVVTKNVPPYSIAIGVPAKVLNCKYK